MKNLGKVFGLVCVSALLFSCSTDEQDLELERAIAVSDKIEESSMKETQVSAKDSISSVEGNPLVIIKRD